MTKDLGLTAAQFGLAAGVFFIGYIVLEIPSNLILHKIGARIWIARILITWGAVATLTGFVQSAHQLYIARFALGLAEAGYFPGIALYLGYWFPSRAKAQALALIIIGIPVASVLGAPISGLILDHVHWFGLSSWRWLFILEGIPAILFGVVTLFYLTDWPAQAKWLPAEEREWIREELLKEKQAKQRIHSFHIRDALRHRDVVLLTGCYFCALTGGYGVSFWLPTILKRLSALSDFKVTLLAALPYAAGLICQQANGWHSDLTRERRWHAAIPIFCCGAWLLLAVFFGANIAVSVALFTLVGASYFAFHPGFWPIPTQFLSESAAAAGIGMINSVGNLGGFVGPMIMGYLVTRTRSFAAGMLYLGGSLFLSSILMLLVKAGRGSAAPHS